MLHILLIQIGWGDVRATSEPPSTAVSLKIPVVEVHGGAVRIAGVHDARQTAREERHPIPGLEVLGVLRTAGGCSGQRLLRHGPVHDAQVDPGLLPNLSAGHHTRDPAATVLADPSVLAELALAVTLLNRGTDLALHLAAELLELAAHGRGVLLVAAQHIRCLVDILVRGDGAHREVALLRRVWPRGPAARLLQLALGNQSEGTDCATSEEGGGGSPWGVGGRGSGGAFIERRWTRKCVSRGMTLAWGGGVPSGGCRSATRSCCRHILRPCGHRCRASVRDLQLCRGSPGAHGE
mmetsp:Transcript_9319/g.17500  ORF Transcript_9319/g.17500 Transcript_9319/m.17500 type:complete len:294 (-) Transcript_9319:159-1040(-)